MAFLAFLAFFPFHSSRPRKIFRHVLKKQISYRHHKATLAPDPDQFSRSKLFEFRCSLFCQGGSHAATRSVSRSLSLPPPLSSTTSLSSTWSTASLHQHPHKYEAPALAAHYDAHTTRQKDAPRSSRCQARHEDKSHEAPP